MASKTGLAAESVTGYLDMFSVHMLFFMCMTIQTGKISVVNRQMAIDAV